MATTTFTTAMDAIEAGRNDTDMVVFGEFSVYEMPDGSYDYFNVGQPANIDGVVVQAKLVARFHYDVLRSEWRSVY